MASNEAVAVPVPRGRYIPATRSGTTIRTAGMTPRRDGTLTVTGRVGAEVDIATARAAAGLAVDNAMAAARSMASADETLTCLGLTVYIACAPGFTHLSAVADGASEYLAASFAGATASDDAARSTSAALPARAAVGVYVLPDNAPVEVALVVEALVMDERP